MTRSLVLAGALAALATRGAHADGSNPEVINPRIKTSNDLDSKRAPQIEVTIVGGPLVPADKFSISATIDHRRVTMKAEKLRAYAEGRETIAIALVVNGQEIWVGGDDECEYDQEGSYYAGTLENLERAIDKLQLGSAGPAGSKGVIISYSTGAEIKLPMGKLESLTGRALGRPKDYCGKIGTDMVDGIKVGMAELSKVTTDRKALIVIGDGNDTNNDAAKIQLAQLKKEATKRNIQVFAVTYKSSVSSEDSVITTLVPSAKTVSSVDGIASELNAIIARMADRYDVTFPGWDDNTQTGLPWDGNDHALTITIDHDELDAFTMNMAPRWMPPWKGGFARLVLILVMLTGVLLLGTLRCNTE